MIQITKWKIDTSHWLGVIQNGYIKIIKHLSSFKIIHNKKKIYSFIFPILGYLFLTFIFYPGLFLDFSDKVPFGEHGDVQNILSIINYSIHTDLPNLYHLPILYPLSYVLSRTHPLFGISVIFKIFNSFGLNLEESTNLYIILSFVFGAFGCYLLTKEFSKNSFLPFVFSSMYIIYRIKNTYIHWLNFLSDFYFPFFLYFFIRYLKTKNKKYIFLFTLFAFSQFLSSVYYGVHLWTCLIPCFLISALILRTISLKNLRNALFGLSIGLISIIIIYFPFLISQQSLEKNGYSRVLYVADIFSHSTLLNSFLEHPNFRAAQFFPGYTIMFFVLYFVVSMIKNKNKKNILFITFLIFLFSMTYLTYVNLRLLDYAFFVFICAIFILILFGWKNLNKWERFILLPFSFYLIFLVQFPYIKLLRSLSLYDFFCSFLPFSGMKAVHRTYPLILPLLIVMAAIGSNKLLISFKNVTKKKVIIVGVIVLLFMILDNFHSRHPIFQRQIMENLPTKETNIYEILPFRENKIILEIPYYFRMKARNSRYMLNWEYHQNCLINGKTPIKPHSSYRDLMNIIGPSQRKFPNEKRLKNLIQKYSVTHIIFHWDLLRKYQRDLDTKEKISQKINSINKYGKVIYKDDKCTLLKTQEFIPIKRIIRTYSLFHLKNNSLVIKLNDKYAGRILVFLNDRLIEKRTLNNTLFGCNFKYENLNITGNRVEIKFQHSVLLNDIYFSGFKNK